VTTDDRGDRRQKAPASDRPDHGAGSPAGGDATAALSVEDTPSAGGHDAGARRPALDDQARREALHRSGAGASSGGSAEARTTVLPQAERRPQRPTRSDPRSAPARPSSRPGAVRGAGRARRARLVLQRVDPWSVFLFSLVASICVGIVLLVAVATLYVVLANLGVVSSVNNLLGEVLGGAGPDEIAEPFFTPGRVLGATAVLAAVDVVLLTVLATLSALLYNLCSSLTGGIELTLGERD
jgi:hypothetical protein